MKRLLILALLLLPLACSPCRYRNCDTPRPYFEETLADKLEVGKTTRADALKIMGQPYPDDPEKHTGRLVYQYTLQRQLILSFDGDVLSQKEWSEKYGIGAR